ncbi:MAG: hypothetical protein WBI17_01630 [Clostridiaceae bacterium]
MLKKIVAKTLMVVILFSTIMTSTVVHAGQEDVPRILRTVNRVVVTELAE